MGNEWNEKLLGKEEKMFTLLPNIQWMYYSWDLAFYVSYGNCQEEVWRIMGP